MNDYSRRDPETRHLMQMFTYDHLPVHLQGISAQCAQLADEMATRAPDGPELTAGLRKLLEAKDCFVRAVL